MLDQVFQTKTVIFFNITDALHNTDFNDARIQYSHILQKVASKQL